MKNNPKHKIVLIIISVSVIFVLLIILDCIKYQKPLPTRKGPVYSYDHGFEYEGSHYVMADMYDWSVDTWFLSLPAMNDYECVGLLKSYGGLKKSSLYATKDDNPKWLFVPESDMISIYTTFIPEYYELPDPFTAAFSSFTVDKHKNEQQKNSEVLLSEDVNAITLDDWVGVEQMVTISPFSGETIKCYVVGTSSEIGYLKYRFVVVEYQEGLYLCANYSDTDTRFLYPIKPEYLSKFDVSSVDE